jgi:hypothetical protein
MAPTTHSAHQQHIDAYDRAAHRAKRVKVHHNSSPEPSTISEDSALIPTSVPDEEYTDDSEFDSDISSELSESSDEPSDDSSDEEDSEAKNATTPGTEAVVNLRANRGKKPVMRLHKGEVGEDIRPFLKDFLPKLKAANEELEAQRRAGTLERVEMEEKADVAMEDEDDGEEQYIELVSSWLPLVSAMGKRNTARLLSTLPPGYCQLF